MKYSPDTVDLPALVGIDPGTSHIEVIRPIAAGETAQIEEARKLFSVVSPIMAMFDMLHWNFQEIQSFTEDLSKSYSGPPTALSNANRLLLNYIASADALLDHFGTTYKRQCRMKKMEVNGFDDLRRNLENNDDDFEFFTHFRNYVIHVAPPVGNLTVTETLGTGRSWSITYRSDDLSRDTRDRLSSCRMLAKNETIDLIQHLKRFHHLMTTRIFHEIVQCFTVNLKATSQFHKTLAKEVADRAPQLRPHLMTYRKQEGGRFKWTFDVLPRDLIAEFGIHFAEDQKDPQQQ